MNSNEICDLVGGIPEIQNFEGALPVDLVGPVGKVPRNLIINLDDSTKKGSHWVAINVDRNGKSCYFDSFAEPPSALLESRFKIISRSTKPVQHLFSDACGQYCILFLYMRTKNLGIQFIQDYMKNLTDFELKNIVTNLKE